MRCSRVARSRRGKYAKGTPSLRPSDKTTHIIDSSKLRLIAEMFMPCPFYLVFARFHDLRQFIQFLASVALIVRQADRMQPEPGAVPVLANMHVHGLARSLRWRRRKSDTPQAEKYWPGGMSAHHRHDAARCHVKSWRTRRSCAMKSAGSILVA
jgi:hypothetical protein